jgi:quercetin dioxygenase-like cupin family protein
MNRTVLSIVLLAAAWVLTERPAAAQAPTARPVRELVAVGRIASVADAPMHLRMLRVSLPAGGNAVFLGAPGVVYGLSGTLALGTPSEARTLQPGEGAFLEAGRKISFTAVGNEPAFFIHVLLATESQLDAGVESVPAAVTELHRWALPDAARRPGPHEFSMTRVTVAPKTPGPPLHQRSGAALYYVLAGNGIITLGDGGTQPRPAGAIQEEPFGFIHTWSNPDEVPLVLLQANLSQEGMPEILFVK